MRKLIFGLLVFIIGVTFFMGETYCWDSPLIVTINQIKFNHTTSSTTNDALDINEDETTTITAPEWTGGTSKEFAYIKNQSSRTIKATFSHGDDNGDIYSMNIQASYTGNNPIGNVPSTVVNFWGTKDSDETTFTTSGTVPNSVNNYSYYWHWVVTKVNGVTQAPAISIDDTYHECYSVLRQPFSSRVFSDGKPWSIILDKSCSWAQGENTDVNVATEITESIYNVGDAYNGEQQYGTSGSDLDISDFLDAVEQNDVTLSCYDTANIYNIFTEAVGCSTKCYFIQGDLDTNEILAVGEDEWDNHPWINHKHGVIGARVYDPCLKITEATPKIPVNMQMTTYQNSVFAPGYSISQAEFSFADPNN